MLLSGIKKAHFELQLITGSLWATLELRIAARLVSVDNLRNTVDDQSCVDNLRIADNTKAGF